MIGGLLALLPLAMAQSTFFPGEGSWGTTLFEDRWPCVGDGDFNDVVVRYQIEKVSNGAYIDRLVMHVAPQALGASECNGLGVRLPVPVTSIASATVRTSAAGWWSGEPWSTATALSLGNASPGYTDAGGATALWIADDLRALCGAAPGFVNTETGSPAVDCATIELDIAFSADPGPLATEPYDLFIHRCGDRSWQVHGPAYGGVEPEFDDTLAATCDVTVGSPFVLNTPANLHNLPFVLTVGEGIGAPGDPDYGWPVEHARIDAAMPGITQLAAGTGGLTWYRTGTVPEKVYAPTFPAPPVRSRRDGSSASHAALSCATLHRDHPTRPNGRYWVDPNGGDPADAVRVACEMVADGGGYTALFNVVEGETQWSLSTTSGTYLHAADRCGLGFGSSFSCVSELQESGFTPWTSGADLMWYIDHEQSPSYALNPWLRARVTGIDDLVDLFTHNSACADRCTDPAGTCAPMMASLTGAGSAHQRWYNAGHSPLVVTYPTCSPGSPAVNHFWNADTATGYRCNADFDRVHIYGDRDNGLGYYQNSAPTHNCYYTDNATWKRESRMLLRERLPVDCAGNPPANPALTVFRFSGVVDDTDPSGGPALPGVGENLSGWVAFDPDQPDTDPDPTRAAVDYPTVPAGFQMVVRTDAACFDTADRGDPAWDSAVSVFDRPTFDRYEAYTWEGAPIPPGYDYVLLDLFLQTFTNLDTVRSDAPPRAVPPLEPWDDTAWVYVEVGRGAGASLEYSAFGATITALVDD